MEGSGGNACTQGPIGEAGGLRSKSRQGKRPDLRGCELGWAEEENPSRAQLPSALDLGLWLQWEGMMLDYKCPPG